MKRKAQHYFLLLLRVGLGLIFVYAGVLKIQDPIAFAGSVAAYKLLPYFFNYLVAATIPWVELTSGLLLIIGYRVQAAAGIIAAMNILFIVLLASTIVRGLDIDCGCFRQGGEKTSAWIAIMRDIIFLTVALILVTEKKERKYYS
ncbi:MAG: DoxX family membrane protein [Deltaproteobacteria bacterium]|nr:DoxX family membrane protein [Deltaproteobacteria bacterium]TLN01876.1 MAG: DoxX family membrane protein [bacterium]